MPLWSRKRCVPWQKGSQGVTRTAVIGALVGIVFIEGLIFAAVPRGRFVDRLFRGSEPTPQLIPVPAPRPPTVAEKQASKKKLAGIQTKESEQPSVSKVDYDWESFVRFAEAIQAVGEHVARVAVDPTYGPAEQPKYQPIFDASELAAIEGQRVASSVGNGTGGRPTPVRVTAASSNPYASKKPIGSLPPKSARLQRLRVRIAQTLATYQRRPMNTSHHSPWEIMHGFVGFGIPTKIRVGGPRGELVNAIGWMNSGGRCRGQVMLTLRDERPHALYGVGLQGHSAQYLAILAQCRVSAKSPLLLGGKNFTVADLIEDEKLNCRSGTELTFALIGLAHYLPTDAVWRSSDGETWSLERLMEEELRQPIRTAPCGGTHRLFSLAYGCQRRLKATGRLDGVYQRANTYVREYQHLTLQRLQNRDGSFSTEWFKYPDNRDDDIDRKVQTTGHILEWLVASLDQERLYENRIIAATEFIATALAREPGRNWKDGPLGHALHAMSIYQERVWGVVLQGNVVAFTGPMKAAATAEVARSDEEIRQATLPNDDKTRL
ncbi:MAG TPA: hypothetical protein DEB70_01570 [Planctomycetaceae bacterium]|nr:hypothetical protein [Planctomycetaceae bacterium]